MWISFTALTALITILFWLILSSSVRLNYTNENIEDEERRFPRSIEKEDVNEEKEVVTDAMKSEELVETEESESL